MKSQFTKRRFTKSKYNFCLYDNQSRSTVSIKASLVELKTTIDSIQWPTIHKHHY